MVMYNSKYNSTQLYFEEVENKLHIAKLCSICNSDCKIQCISEDVSVICNRYKKRL